jgi:signal peptidase I
MISTDKEMHDQEAVSRSASKSAIVEYVQALSIAILAALILRIFVVQAFRIPTGSMKDTLIVGDFLLVNKFVYGVRTPDYLAGTEIKIPHVRLPGFRTPQRGDIIIFKFPKDPRLDYIKRCVGLPGDTIEVRSNFAYVNGVLEGDTLLIDEQFDPEEHAMFQHYRIETLRQRTFTIRKRTKRPSRLADYGPVVVPPNHLFMMGDNRDNSSDSRYWGFLPQENIVGRAMIIYFSFDKSGSPSALSFIDAIRWQRIFQLIR